MISSKRLNCPRTPASNIGGAASGDLQSAISYHNERWNQEHAREAHVNPGSSTRLTTKGPSSATFGFWYPIDSLCFGFHIFASIIWIAELHLWNYTTKPKILIYAVIFYTGIILNLKCCSLVWVRLCEEGRHCVQMHLLFKTSDW